MRYVITIIIFSVIAGFIYIRFAPIYTAAVHVAPSGETVGDFEADNSFLAVRNITTPAVDLMTLLDRIILDTPRTRRIAGLPGLDVITYETRSAFFGFPDYTTVTVNQESLTPLLIIKGRARFGLFDIGVNKARILGWIAQLGPLTVAP